MKLVLLALVCVYSSAIFARGYGMAGCGLGSILLGDKKGYMQILAATSNGLAGNQTFAMSTGTSNCQDGSGKTATVFIEANREALANDVARGQGETLETLATMYGCQNSQNMGKLLQSNYQSIFPSAEVKAEEINAKIINLLQEQNSCSTLG